MPPGNKEIKFKIVTDEQSAASVRRILQGMIGDATKLSQILGGRGGAGPNLSGLFGGGPAAGGRSPPFGSAAKSGPVGAAGKSPLAASLLENAAALKSMAKAGGDSMRVLTESVSRAVEQQRRHLRSLDGALDSLGKRYEKLSNERAAAIAAGVDPVAAGAGFGTAGGQIARISGQRAAAQAQLQQLQALQQQVSPQYLPQGPLLPPPPGGGGGWNYGNSAFGKMFPARNARGQLFRPGFVAGAVGAGILAGANELVAQPFDLVSNQAKQAQAMGGMGVATKQGDMRYAMALYQVLRDPDKRAELGLVGDRNFSYGISGVGGTVKNLLGGDPNVPGGMLRGVMNVNSRQKEALRSYLDQQVQSDPNFYANLGRFQGEASGRLGLMRRTGFGEAGLTRLLRDVGYGAGQDVGDVSGAFEALRGGGRRFAQRNLGAALRAGRGGMDLAAVSGLAGAGAQDLGGLLGGLSGIDVVGSEHLARAIAGAMGGSGYGPTSGRGMLGAMTGVGFGDRPESDTYRAGQRAGALPGVAQLLGGGADPFGRGLNVLAANRIVGPGGDFYKARALAQLGGDPAALMAAMSGESSGLLKAQGITQSDATRMFEETVTRNVRSRFISGAGGNAPSDATATMQRLVDTYGGDPRAMFLAEGKSGAVRERLLNELGAGMSEILPQTFASPASGREAMATLIGARGPGRKGRGLGDAGGGSLARAYTAGRIGAGEEEMGEFLKSSDAQMMGQFARVMKPLGDAMLRMGEMDTSAGRAAASLLALVRAAENLRGTFDRMSRLDRGKALDAERNRLLGQADAAKAASVADAARRDAAEDAAASRRGGPHSGDF